MKTTMVFSVSFLSQLKKKKAGNLTYLIIVFFKKCYFLASLVY